MVPCRSSSCLRNICRNVDVVGCLSCTSCLAVMSCFLFIKRQVRLLFLDKQDSASSLGLICLHARVFVQFHLLRQIFPPPETDTYLQGFGNNLLCKDVLQSWFPREQSVGWKCILSCRMTPLWTLKLHNQVAVFQQQFLGARLLLKMKSRHSFKRWEPPGHLVPPSSLLLSFTCSWEMLQFKSNYCYWCCQGLF